jgi:hypothetical protein
MTGYVERATTELNEFVKTVNQAYSKHPAIMRTLTAMTLFSAWVLRAPIVELAVNSAAVITGGFSASYNYLTSLISSKGAEAAAATSNLDLNADGAVNADDAVLAANEASKQVNSYFTATSAFLISGAAAATYGAYSYLTKAPAVVKSADHKSDSDLDVDADALKSARSLPGKSID